MRFELLQHNKSLFSFFRITINFQEISSLCHNHLSFPIFRNFLPNRGRILPALTYNGPQPLNVNAARILPGFGRKLRNIGKLDYSSAFTDWRSFSFFHISGLRNPSVNMIEFSVTREHGKFCHPVNMTDFTTCEHDRSVLPL